MKKFVSMLLAAVMLAAMLCIFAVNVSADEADDRMNEAAQLENAGQYGDAADAYMTAATQYELADDYASATDAYVKAGECFIKSGDFSAAGDSFYYAAQAAWKKAKNPTASTLSEGNFAIITAVAGIAVGLVGGLVIGKKKQSEAIHNSQFIIHNA